MIDKICLNRFFIKIQKTNSCWIWKGKTNKFGYGIFYIKRKQKMAHRISYTIHKGEIPKKLCVLHKCDNPPCVNPKHLWVGTRADNMFDMNKKGRHWHPNYKGKNNPFYGKHHNKQYGINRRKKFGKIFEITSPKGKVIKFQSIRFFCKKYHFNYGHISMLKRKIITHARHWTNFRLL